MSDDIIYPFMPVDQLFDRYDSIFGGDYTKTWGHTMGMYHRRGIWITTIILGDTRQFVGEVMTAACYGAALGADQAVWYACAMENDRPAFMADRYLVSMYADRWGSKAYRKRKVAVYDDGSVHGVGGWEQGATDGKMLDALVLAWELDTVGDPSAILPLLRGRGHLVSNLDGG